jgi:hypothetical protein
MLREAEKAEPGLVRRTVSIIFAVAFCTNSE